VIDRRSAVAGALCSSVQQAAQKRPINSRFSVIFEKPVVAGQSHNFCFKSAMFEVEVGIKRSLSQQHFGGRERIYRFR
jgi:hypothetical protein